MIGQHDPAGSTADDLENDLGPNVAQAQSPPDRVRLVSWNVNGRDLLAELEPLDADLALLQEVRLPKRDAFEILPHDDEGWETAGGSARHFRTAIVRLSDRVKLEPRRTVGLGFHQGPDEWGISAQGSITVVDVVVGDRVVFTAVSVYAPWEMGPSRRGYADAAAHRILSDLSMLMDSSRHRLIVAGDWNILRGYGEHGSGFWRDRYQTVFDRAEILGLVFVGPEFPNGRQADPWPDELPRDNTCVPTFRHSRQTPATASRQLDFVFASRTLAADVKVHALNEIDEWGPSDHCRVLIEVSTWDFSG